jgi:hypothetical protein
MDFSFIQTVAANKTLLGTAEIIFSFVQTTPGEILWVRIDPDTGTVETWTQITHTGDSWVQITHSGDTWTPITHTGDTWTEISGNGNVETWLDKVV